MTVVLDYADLPAMAGCDLGCSDWVELTQAHIDAFAELTGDRQWIHVDVDRARREGVPTIGHGFFVLSLLSGWAEQIFRVEGAARGLNYGFNRVRFITAVPVGSRLRLHLVLKDVASKPDGLVLTFDCTVEIQGQDRPAVAAEWLGIVCP